MPMPSEVQGHKAEHSTCILQGSTLQGKSLITPFDKCSGEMQGGKEAQGRGRWIRMMKQETDVSD